MRSLHDYLTGGAVRGPGTATSDSILARLSNGEYVLPKVAVDQVGVQNLEAIRRAALAKAPRMRLGGPISTLADKAVQAAIARPHAVKNTVVGSLLENTLGIGPGLGGLAAGMTRSAPAQAAVLDNTQTQEYQQAQDAIRQGRGNEPTGGIFGLKGILAGPTPAETVRELEQQQAVQDEQYRQLVGGGPTPTEQRMLQDMNRASVKGYALGGLISQKQWEGLPRFAEGTPGSLDKESDGEFDRNRGLLPQAIDAIQRIQTIPPAERTRAQNLFTGRGLFGKEQDALVPPSPKPTPLPPTGQAVSTPIPSATPPAPSSVSADDRQRYIALEDQLKKSGGTPPPRPPSMMEPTATPTSSPKAPVGAVTTGAGTSPVVPSFPSLISGGSWQDLAQPGEWEQTKQALQNRNPTPAKSVMLQPGARDAGVYAQQVGGKILANGPGPGIGPQSVVAAPSRPIGTQSYTTGQPFEPSQGTEPPPPLMGSQRIMSGNGVTGPVTTGGSNVPIYQTDYTVFGPKGQQGTLSVTGPDQRVGGGTVSQPDQGNGGTVEGNVAALNRQIDALRSLREARNPGITTGGSALPAAPASVDMWARPGDSFGDSQMRQARYEGLLKDAANQTGLGAKQRSAALIDAAAGLLAPGAASAKLAAEQQQAANSLTGQLAQARAQQEASKYGADVGLAGHKYTADASLAGARLKAEQEAQQSKTKNDIDLANAMSARISATGRNALPAEKQTLLQLVDAYSKLDPKSAEGQRLKLLIDALNPPKDQASLVDEMAAKLKAQESQ